MAGFAGEAAAQALRTAFLRQPDPEALEYIAEALAYLLDLSGSARPVVAELAGCLKGKFLEVAPALSAVEVAVVPAAAGADDEGSEVPPADSLLFTATRLRILAKAFDVSLCDLRAFGATVLGLLDDRAAAAAEGQPPPVGPQLAVALLELMVLVLLRQVAAFLQPEPLARCVAHDPIEPEELRLAPTAAQDLCTVALGLLKADPNQQVRTAAFTTAVALLTGSWNASRFAGAAASAASTGGGLVAAAQPAWVLPLGEELCLALCGHLGELLTEANAVPASSGVFAGAPEPGSVKHASAFSQLFNGIQRVLAVASADGGAEAAAVCAAPDSERVRLAVLACALLAGCRHPDVERSHLPALVLSQALSSREDMQEAAWVLLRRLRKEAHWQSESAEAFFLALLHAVRLVHQDAGIGVARDLSYRLMQRVGVGKLSPTSQAGMLAALRQGVEVALAGERREGLLEALVPWVTKHILDNELLEDLAGWAEQQALALGGEDLEKVAERAGLRGLLEACFATIKRGQPQRPQATPALRVEATTPTRGSTGACAAGSPGSVDSPEAGAASRGAVEAATDAAAPAGGGGAARPRPFRRPGSSSREDKRRRVVAGPAAAAATAAAAAAAAAMGAAASQAGPMAGAACASGPRDPHDVPQPRVLGPQP